MFQYVAMLTIYRWNMKTEAAITATIENNLAIFFIITVHLQIKHEIQRSLLATVLVIFYLYFVASEIQARHNRSLRAITWLQLAYLLFSLSFSHPTQSFEYRVLYLLRFSLLQNFCIDFMACCISLDWIYTI